METNEKTPPEPSKKRRKFYPVTKEKYEEMWRLFKNATSLRDIAKQTGVHEKTVKKYVDVGDPSRGLEPMRLRLESINKRIRERISVVHAKERVEHYGKAAGAFKQGLDVATATMDRMKKYQDEAAGKPLAEFDDSRLGQMLKNADLAAGLVQKWNDIMTALYVGEQSQQMLEDIKEFEETGNITPELKGRVLEIFNNV